SMGIYIFTTKVLKKYLIEDEANPESSNDFGKNIIPNMLGDGCPMYSYTFEGYWKDVGTLTSLWEANMDLLGNPPAFDLYDRNFRIFYRHEAYPPHRIGKTSSIKNSMITEGCIINGTVENSVLANGVTVEEGAVVRDCVIMSGVHIKAGTKLEYAIVDSDTVIGENSVIGEDKKNKKLLLVGAGLAFPANSKIEGGLMIDSANIKDYTA
ncbi:MAG: glucose-1-phosphate adenylyltransferase, partial [Clostridia bacterium]|nr:glucose-1-phosphate adenylyltransferase [Clostridia bacterium]